MSFGLFNVMCEERVEKNNKFFAKNLPTKQGSRILFVDKSFSQGVSEAFKTTSPRRNSRLPSLPISLQRMDPSVLAGAIGACLI
jgi:hypothetical protein